MPEKWKLEGTVFDACNCQTLCPCVYFQAPNGSDCRATGVWHIEKGNYGKTKLDDFTVAGVLYATQNPLMGIEKAAWILDEKLRQEQRDALTQILGGKAGGLFSMMSVKTPFGIFWAKFEYSNDRKSWWVKAGKTLNIRAEFVKAPPGTPFKSEPKTAQTYDPLFAPSMEKIVGVTQQYQASVGGLEYEISGRYSSSGRFSYQGP
ncbi:MAG: DUF1326 domain-containing protein [Thaumarchaeota archaeon]|nr:DUF1326 domain-containing protein [Nitrososphaerota archaeon]